MNSACYRVMLNIKRIDHVLNTTVYSMTNTVPLIHLVRHRQLKFLGHILRMFKGRACQKIRSVHSYHWQKETWSTTYFIVHTLIMYKDCLGIMKEQMQEQQIAAFADDRHAWRNLVVACSAADG